MRTVSVFVLAIAITACSKPSEPAPAAPAPQPPAAAPRGPALADQPAAAAAQPSGGSPKAGGLTWTAPKPFVARTPKSSMRAAEYGIEGDAQSELTVFYFGADQGGGVEANMNRWIGQFKQADGSDAVAQRGERTVNNMSVATVEATGNYGGGMAAPGAPPPAAIENAGLLGAIAKGPEGSVFFKLVGPRATLDGARPAFDQLIESLRKAE
jgi:hypothetical protein